MKKFKQLYKQILEDYTEGGSVFNGFMGNPARSAENDFGVFRIDQGDSMARINAFIHRFLGGSYVDPNAAIKELRSRLNHVGIDFQFDGNKVKLNPGINTFPIKHYGDVFGQTPTTDLSKGFDRGEDLAKGVLEILCSYDEDSCMWMLKGKIKLGNPSGPVNENVGRRVLELGTKIVKGMRTATRFMNKTAKNLNKANPNSDQNRKEKREKLSEGMLGKVMGAVKKGAEVAGEVSKAADEIKGMMPPMPGAGSATEKSGGAPETATGQAGEQAAAAVAKGKTEGKKDKEKFNLPKEIEGLKKTTGDILSKVSEKPSVTQSAAQIRNQQLAEEKLLIESLVNKKKDSENIHRKAKAHKGRSHSTETNRSGSSKLHSLAKKLREAYSKKKKGKKMCEYGCGDGGASSAGPMSATIPSSETVVGDPMRFKQMPMFEGKLDKHTAKKQSKGSQDRARSIMHMINRKGEIRDRVLMPIFNHLLQKKNKGQLKLDQIQRELYYVVNSAMRKAKTTLTKTEKDRVVNDLVRNFSKFAKSHKLKKKPSNAYRDWETDRKSTRLNSSH